MHRPHLPSKGARLVAPHSRPYLENRPPSIEGIRIDEAEDETGFRLLEASLDGGEVGPGQGSELGGVVLVVVVVTSTVPIHTASASGLTAGLEGRSEARTLGDESLALVEASDQIGQNPGLAGEGGDVALGGVGVAEQCSDLGGAVTLTLEQFHQRGGNSQGGGGGRVVCVVL